jgi:hypothetical protein
MAKNMPQADTCVKGIKWRFINHLFSYLRQRDNPQRESRASEHALAENSGLFIITPDASAIL